MQSTEGPPLQELSTHIGRQRAQRSGARGLTAGIQSNNVHPASRRRWGRFTLHYLEMVVVMLVAMFVLGVALRAVLAAGGVAYSVTRFPEALILEMGLTMALGMAAWMRYRGHSWMSSLEMSAAMLVPALAVVPLVWLDVLGSEPAMALEHTAMFLLMLAVMLRRRDEYVTAHRWLGRVVPAASRGPVRWRLGRGLVALLGFLLVPAVVFVAGSTTYERSRYAQADATAATAEAVATATPPAHDPSKPTAVVVVGNSGANVADTLAPYEVLASTGAFNVYTVAPERRPVPLLGGLDLVPDFTFAQLREQLGGAAPDVTVVPDLPTDESSDAAVTAWLRDTASEGLLLGVCTGARLLAEAGLLDGRDATSHWFRLSGLERRHPEVNWQRGTRYLDDGDVITTGGLLSSIDGTLRVVERFVDADTAAAAAQAVGWPSYTPGTAPALPQARLAPTDAVLHLLNVGFGANTTTVGVVLTDGVGELELAAAFAPYAEGKSARMLAVTADGGSIRSRHGLTFVPRDDLDAASDVDRLLVPGSEAAASPAPEVADAGRRAGVPVEYLHQQPGFAFDPALRELARNMDVPTTRWTGKILEYSSTELGLSGPMWPWTLTLRPLLLGLVGLAAALGAAGLVHRHFLRKPSRSAQLR